MTAVHDAEDGVPDRVDASYGKGVQVGNGNVQNLYFGLRREVSWPRRVGVVPPLAVGRQFRPADQDLAGAGVSGTAVVCQVVAGLGGVGKTQLAVNLVEQLWASAQVDLVVWATATSRTAVLSVYSLAAGEVIGVDDADPQQAATRLLSWLATTDRRWLIVLDDLTDPADLTGLWPPHTPTGRTVVTTRRRDAALLAGRSLVDVGVFTPDQSIAYLTRLLGNEPARVEQARELAADLGHLPLALAQGAAYMVDQDLCCIDYRGRLTRRPLARLHPDALPDQQSLPVARAWALSIQVADAATGGLATIVLRLAALLDPNGIPTPVFTTSAVLGYCRKRLDQDVDADLVHDTLRVLYRLSLADTTDDSADGGNALRVHALVQRVTRESTPETDTHRLVIAAADALAELWPAIERDPATGRLGQQLRANTTTLTGTAGSLLWHTLDGRDEAHRVLFQAGSSLGEIGLVNAARDYYQQLYAITADLFGRDRPDTLTIRANLAYWRGAAGDPAGAAAGFERLLTDELRVLGPDHPDTLITRGNLARWRGAAGDAAGAAAGFERLLTDELRVLGPDHPDTLITRGNLAWCRGVAGDAAGAEAALERLLTDRLRVLGPDHPDTLTTRANIAYWRGEAGDAAGAAAGFERLLTDRLRVLGPDHPDTLITRGNLAERRGQAGDAAGAAAGYERLLADCLRVLGPDHPETLTTRHHLADWRGQAGDPAGAAAAFDLLLIDRLRVLGPDHPRTLTTRHHLADWRGQAGDAAGAAAAFDQLLADRLRVLGADDPATLTTRHHLASWRGHAGDAAGAAAAFDLLLADRLRVLGADHPQTLITRDSLAYWRARAGL